MTTRHDILQHLLATKNLAAERVVDVILGDATAPEQRELADLLLKRNKRTGWVALIRAFDRLDESVRRQVVASPRDLFGPLAETMQDSDGPARENVIAIVRQCADVKLTYLLAQALIDARPVVRDLAGRALTESVRAFLAIPAEQRSLTGYEDAAQMDRAIDHGLRQFKTHRQSAAILAALALERRQDGHTWACFTDSYDEGTRAATLLLRAAQDPLLARGLLVALGSPLKPAAVAGLGAAEQPELVAALARESFRLADPLLRSGAATVPHARLFAVAKKHSMINGDTWPQWIRLIEVLGLPPARKAALLIEMLPLAADDRAWRIAIAGAAAGASCLDAAHLLARLADDPDEVVARIAARHLVGRGPSASVESRTIIHNLAANRHASVRRILQMAGRAPVRPSATAGAGEGRFEPKETQFQRVWDQYAQLPPALQHAQARAAAGDPASSDALRAKLANPHVAELAQGLKMLAAIGNLAPYRGEVIALCGHDDPRVAAIAVKLAARLNDPRLHDLLELAAQHPDSRVRSNAVESMEALHIADKSQQVLTLLNSRHNRERANAIKAISQFDFATARECLTRMLADPNPMHRISALWVVDRLGLLEMVRQVSGMARRDPNIRVRSRAAAMLDTLTAHTVPGE